MLWISQPLVSIQEKVGGEINICWAIGVIWWFLTTFSHHSISVRHLCGDSIAMLLLFYFTNRLYPATNNSNEAGFYVSADCGGGRPHIGCPGFRWFFHRSSVRPEHCWLVPYVHWRRLPEGTSQATTGCHSQELLSCWQLSSQVNAFLNVVCLP